MGYVFSTNNLKDLRSRVRTKSNTRSTTMPCLIHRIFGPIYLDFQKKNVRITNAQSHFVRNNRAVMQLNVTKTWLVILEKLSQNLRRLCFIDIMNIPDRKPQVIRNSTISPYCFYLILFDGMGRRISPIFQSEYFLNFPVIRRLNDNVRLDHGFLERKPAHQKTPSIQS